MAEKKHKEHSDASFHARLAAYLICAVIALALPTWISATYSIYWACLAGVLITLLWVAVMPCTCRSGGLLSSMIGILIILNGCGHALAAGFKFIRSLF